MCEATVYLIQEGQEERLLESVDELSIQGQEIRIINIFGEQKVLKAKFKSYSAGDRKILLEQIE